MAPFMVRVAVKAALLTCLVLLQGLGPAAWAGSSTNSRSHSARPGALPDLRITRGTKDIAEVWLGDPTTRYRHYVLGSDYEAASLFVRPRNGKVLKLRLDKRSVFEDREPRLADLDGDGRDEIIVMRSYLNGGAALAVYGLRDGKIMHIAETPDMGHPFGWLNPAGIADFDGDGAQEILFVRKPHVLGQLEMWRLEPAQISAGPVSAGSAQGKKLRRVLTLGNTSNHIAGTKFIRLWANADFNGDGIVDLAIPSFDRRTLRFITFKGGTAKEFSRKSLPARAASDFTVVQRNHRALVSVGLAKGRHALVAP